MAVLKSKRKQSRLEVIHNYYKLRDAMTFKLFNNFGYLEYHAEEDKNCQVVQLLAVYASPVLANRHREDYPENPAGTVDEDETETQKAGRKTARMRL